MEVPKQIIDWANWMLEKEGEPIRFKKIELSTAGRAQATGTVTKMGIPVPVEIKFFARNLEGGRLLCEQIELSSSSKLADTVLGWLRNTILRDLKIDLLPYGVVIDIE